MIQISAKNFRSFREVSYTIKPSGIVAIEGMYEGTKDRSNGAGKSTLIPELLCWAIYGETVDGKVDVCSNYDDADHVEVSVSLPFVEWVRSQKADGTGKKIQLDGIRNYTDAKEALLKKFPPKRVFASTMILGQGVGERFSSWTPATRASILGQLLNLTIWPEARKRISKDRGSYNNKLAQAQGALQMVEGQILGLQQTPQGDPAKREQAEKQVKKLGRELHTLQHQYNEANASAVASAADVGRHDARVLQLDTSITQARQDGAGMAMGLFCPTCQRQYPKNQVTNLQEESK